MKKLMQIFLQMIGWAALLWIVYVLFLTGIIWILLIIFFLLLFFVFKSSNSSSKHNNSGSNGKNFKSSIQNNSSCHKCGNVFCNDQERHSLTGYCFSCLSTHEDLLIQAFNSERKDTFSELHDRKLYDIYISSPKWKRVRAQKVSEAGNKCFNCESKNNLQVHHHSYASLGNEEMSDLTVLCSECHNLLHELRKSKILQMSRKNRIHYDLKVSVKEDIKVNEDIYDIDRYMQSIEQELELDTSATISGKKVK